MTDYITLTINEIVLEKFIFIIMVFILLWVTYQLCNILKDESKRNKEKEAQKRAIPYKKEYERLLKQEKFKEAIAYGQKHDVHLTNSFYYW